MILLTIGLIAVFTFLQVTGQLKSLTQQNILKAKFGGIVAKNALEKALNETSDSRLAPKALADTLSQLKQSGIVEDVEIFNQDGKTVAASDKYLLNSILSAKEQHAVKALFKLEDKVKQYQSQIDKEKKVILQYMPLMQNVCVIPQQNAQAETAALSAQLIQKLTLAYIAKVSYHLGNIESTLKAVYLPCIFIAIMIILGNILLSIILSKIVIGPLKILNDASKEIAGGRLELRITLPTGDEMEEVANTFNDMAVSLMRMKERAENANPLTKLPGNNVIHEEIEKRLAGKRKFVVVYSDLDNFKAFNDKYGIGAGDVAIKLTAQIMQDSLKLGAPDDFLGHEGGDDFVLLTVPEKMNDVTNYITTEFDKKIRALYNKEDLDRGYIVAKSREGDIKQFPIITLSLAGVSNINRTLTSYGEITNICASVKKVAKKTPGSVFVLDRRLEDSHPDEAQH